MYYRNNIQPALFRLCQFYVDFIAAHNWIDIVVEFFFLIFEYFTEIGMAKSEKGAVAFNEACMDRYLPFDDAIKTKKCDCKLPSAVNVISATAATANHLHISFLDQWISENIKFI